MNADGFIRWALDDARTVEERYTTELIVEVAMMWWNSRNNISRHESLEDMMERHRQRDLNPAYDPRYSEADVRHATESLPTVNMWWFSNGGLDTRPIRDLKAFGFLTHLEQVHLQFCEVTDVSTFAELPKLRSLKFTSNRCVDLRPLAGCAHLRELELGIGMGWGRVYSRWPDVSGLEKLGQLESLTLIGNLHVFPRGITWPNVRTAILKCDPLTVRSVRDLPQLPACEFLTLAGVEQLDGIEAFPRLRNLKVETDVRDFAPLAGLDKLTCFTCTGFEPLDVSPLTRLPKLQVAIFNANFQYALTAPKPRDFSVFAEAPALRELHVPGCPPVESEVKMLNSFLPPWDDVWLAETPRPLSAALRMIMAPLQKHPQNHDTKLDAGDNGLPDEGLRECEGRWTGRFMEKTITARLGEADWGTTTADGKTRRITVTIESFAVVEKLPQIVEAMREVLARLHHDYNVQFMVQLKSPKIVATPAQVQLEQQFQDERDKAEREHREQDQKEYLERLHRYELKKQLGKKIKPEDFVPPPPAPMPLPPWEREDGEDDNDSSNEDGGVAVKEKPDPPPSWLDDEHPLADNYRLMGFLTLAEIWFMPHHRDIVIYLMRRQPDLEIPDEKPVG
jgi:hypothetical protein